MYITNVLYSEGTKSRLIVVGVVCVVQARICCIYLWLCKPGKYYWRVESVLESTTQIHRVEPIIMISTMTRSALTNKKVRSENITLHDFGCARNSRPGRKNVETWRYLAGSFSHHLRLQSWIAREPFKQFPVSNSLRQKQNPNPTGNSVRVPWQSAIEHHETQQSSKINLLHSSKFAGYWRPEVI